MSALSVAEQSAFDAQQFRAYPEIPPHHHDVIAFRGTVLVYETDAIGRDGGVIEGAFYVLENQNPVSGMSWETHDRLNRQHAERGEPRTPVKIKRRVVQAVRWQRRPDHWLLVTPEGFKDGPFPDWTVTFDLIGKVVGAYMPATATSKRRTPPAAKSKRIGTP